MLFSSLGRYPEGTVFLPNGFFHADETLVFSVVQGESWRDQNEDLAYSEFDWLSPQEIRLLSSILLCERSESWRMTIYPISRSQRLIDIDKLDVGSPDAVALVKQLILENGIESESIELQSIIKKCLGSNYTVDDGSDYYDLDRVADYWNNIAPDNYVLARGMTALIKSDMLASHSEFFEEALLPLYIALESSFELVKKRLRDDGVLNPTTNDAAIWLHQHFDKHFGHPLPDAADGYFAEYYRGRIMTMHPASRYGVVPYSPTMHDDVLELRENLRKLFSFFVSGRHDSAFEKIIERHGVF